MIRRLTVDKEKVYGCLKTGLDDGQRRVEGVKLSIKNGLHGIFFL